MKIMTNKDYCMRAISIDGSVKLWVARTTDLCETARKNHDCWSVAAAALGRLLTSAAFFGQNLKGDDTVTLRIDGDGPLKTLVAVANAKGELRGYVANPQVDIARKAVGKLDVGAAVGNGSLSVIKDMGFGDPYVGTVPLATGEIGDDISKYFVDSEQIPTATGVGVKIASDGFVEAAGGFLLQLLPNADGKTVSQLELNIANLVPVSQMVADGWTAEEIANDIMLGVPYKVLETNDLIYKCNCSHEKISAAIMSLGYKEVKALIEEQGEAEVVCRFCGKKHHFSKEELEKILKELDVERMKKFRENLVNQLKMQDKAVEEYLKKHSRKHNHGENCGCGCHDHEHEHEHEHHHHSHSGDCGCGEHKEEQ